MDLESAGLVRGGGPADRVLSVSISPCLVDIPFSPHARLCPGPWKAEPRAQCAGPSPSGDSSRIRAWPCHHAPDGGSRGGGRQSIALSPYPLIVYLQGPWFWCVWFSFKPKGAWVQRHVQCWLYGHVQEVGLRTRWEAGQGQEGDRSPAVSGARTPQPATCSSHPSG